MNSLRSLVVRLCVAAAMTLCLAPPARAQCGSDLSRSFGGETAGVAMVNSGLVLVGSGEHLYLLNISVPGSPSHLTRGTPEIHLDAPISKISMTPGAGRAYVMLNNGNVCVIRLTSFGFIPPFPNTLSVESVLHPEARDILADGDRVFIVSTHEPVVNGDYSSSRILVYDNSSGRATFVSLYERPFDIYYFDRIVRLGSVYWVGLHVFQSNVYGLTGISYANPASPQEVVFTLNANITGLRARVDAMTTIGNRVFMAYEDGTGRNKIRAIDVLHANNPNWLTPTEIGTQLVTDLAASGNNLHIAFSNVGALTFWNVSNPEVPDALGTYQVPGGLLSQIAAGTGSDFVAARKMGLQIINTTDPSAMTLRAQILPEPASANLVRQHGNDTVIADNDSNLLRVIDFSGANQVNHGTIGYGAPATGLELLTPPGGVYACVVSGFDNLVRVYNLTNHDLLTQAATINVGAHVTRMSVSTTLLHVLDDQQRLSTYEMATPSNPLLRSRMQFGGGVFFRSLASWPGAVAIGTSTGLWLIDMSNPASPQLRSVWAPNTNYEIAGCARGPFNLYVTGWYGPSNDTRPFFEALNVGNLAAPTLAYRIDRTNSAYIPVAARELVFVSDASHSWIVGTPSSTEAFGPQMAFYNIDIPTLPVMVDSTVYYGVGGRVAPFSNGAHLYAAAGDAGVVDITVPTQWSPAFYHRLFEDEYACPGGSVTFRLGDPAVSASPAGVSYQWEASYGGFGVALEDGPTGWGSTISGAHSPTLTISGLTTRDITVTADEGVQYSCVVSGLCGLTWSGSATIVTCPPDFNCDGFLDFFDIDAFGDCFETGNCPGGRTADFNGDEFVDFFDFDAFVGAFELGC